jgi:hypothetical protein
MLFTDEVAEGRRVAADGTIDMRAAVWSGLAAGSIATAVQILLWWVTGAAVPDLLLRDARLTAAMVLGAGVLPPSSALLYPSLLVATLVHLLLSAVYGGILAGFIRRLGRLPSLCVGLLYGLLLYGINMYGFTHLFPWFAQARGGITVAVHAVFGLGCAVLYRAWARR